MVGSYPLCLNDPGDQNQVQSDQIQGRQHIVTDHRIHIALGEKVKGEVLHLLGLERVRNRLRMEEQEDRREVLEGFPCHLWGQLEIGLLL